MGPKREDKNFNPFPGLRPFSPGESELFFGREEESGVLLKKLLQNRFVTVIGASGSGKSSLVHSGVLPKLKGSNSDNPSEWRIMSFRPGNDPFGNLADALADDIEARGQVRPEKVKVLSELHNNPEGISGAAKSLMIRSDEKILMVVDQFEELFRFNPQGKPSNAMPVAARFVDFIVKAVSELSVNIFTVVVMRSDYIGECAQYQELTRLINASNYLVPLMGKDNYRKVIEGPVKYAGNKIDPQLVETLLNDIGNKSDQLPVLQHVMMRTYDHWLRMNEPDRPVGEVDYESVGTMQRAMSMHANEAYDELDNRGKEICRTMFKIITGKGSDNKGYRRPDDVETITSIAGCNEEELYDVIEKFRVPSRSFLTPRLDLPITEESIIDISHESLINLWDRLRDWVDEESSSVQMYKRLSEASAMYQQGKTGILRPPDLQMAVNWREENKPTLAWAERYNPAFERAMVYLRTSEKEYLEEEETKLRSQRKKIKRTRVIASGLGVAVIVSLSFMLFAIVRKSASDRARALAQVERTKAEQQKIKADSIALVAAAERTAAITDAKEAEQVAQEADNSAKIANQEKYLALREREVALENEKMAVEEKEQTHHLRMLSVGKSMAIRSLQFAEQKGLKAALAFQAFLFNRNNNGPENDADIFAGLYDVARRDGDKYYQSFRGQEGDIKSIAFAPASNEFYTSGSDGKIIKWSLDGADRTVQVIYSGSEIMDVLAVSPDDSWLACGGENSVIRMIPLKPDNQEYNLQGHAGKINSLVFSYDGKFLYSAALDGKVLKWDLAVRTSTDVTDGSVHITSIDLSGDGKHLAGISKEGGVIVWNPGNNEDKFSIDTKDRDIRAIRFDPGNNLLALGDATGKVELWDIAAHRKISEIIAHDSQINDIQFNTRLKQMATAGNDRKIKLFNIENPEDLSDLPVTFSDNDGVVLVMQFSPDGQFIVSGEFEGSRNLISRPTNADYLAVNFCDNLTRNMTQQEWNNYVGRDIPFEKTCDISNFRIKVDAIKK